MTISRAPIEASFRPQSGSEAAFAAHRREAGRQWLARRRDRPVGGFTIVEIMIVVTLLGILVSMAIPGFTKIRATSQNKAVLNNARQLAAAADQYFLQYGVSVVAVSELVGSTSYVKILTPVAGESYPVSLTEGAPITITGVGGVRTLTYAP